MDQKLVSIIIPAYNVSPYIEETLQSVQNQTYQNWECIIVNDESEDNTPDIVGSFCRKDSRFKLININKSGVSKARNVAISVAKGDYLVPLDGDDKIHAECITKFVLTFNQFKGVKLVYPETELFGEASGNWNLPPFNYDAMLKYNMIGNTCMFLKSDYEETDGYRENMTHGLEDWDFLISLLFGSEESQVIKINEVLFFYRITGKGRGVTLALSEKNQEMLDNIIFNNYKIYRKKFPDIFNRIHSYDYNKAILNKTVVKSIIKLLNFAHKLKNRLWLVK